MKKLYSCILLILFSNNILTAQVPELWGMTQNGGSEDLGTIFKINADGSNYTRLLDFHKQPSGAQPVGELVEANNGKLYGMTLSGGIDQNGVLYEYDQSTLTYSDKFYFNNSDGIKPHGSLILANNGKLYGMTSEGAGSSGVLFEYNPLNSIYTKKMNFDYSNGAYPQGSLLQATNGKLYGMTSQGGTYDLGVLFEYDISNSTYTRILDFDGTNGASPQGTLIQATNGKLIGMTSSGGSNSLGVLFEYDIATNIYTKKYDFDGTNGASPYGNVIQTSNGNLFGMTPGGGIFAYGVLFEYNLSTSTYSKKIDFDGANGGYPYSSLMQSTDGKLFGMTAGGGPNNYGVLFSYDFQTFTYNKKFDFEYSNGYSPFGGLMQASNGKFFGAAREGGTYGSGALFEYDDSIATYKKLLNFRETIGSYPNGDLLQSSNGKLYGMTSQGGSYNSGVLFEYDACALKYNKKIDFDGINGAIPLSSLIQASNGKLYGVTIAGGNNNSGVLFEFDASNSTLVKKYDFDYPNGARPRGSLMQASNGKLYGMTNKGGSYNFGVLFEYNIPTSTYTKIFDFDGANGANPESCVMQATNGKLYGMTNKGGLNNLGVLFEYDYVASIYTKKIDFNGTNGGDPYGGLLQASNGKIYGLTGGGSLFEYDISNSICVQKFNSDGGSTYCSLIQASNGRLYGMFTQGGLWNAGELFEYNINTSNYSIIRELIHPDGTRPFGSFIEIFSATPESPGTINGPQGACKGQNGVVYSVIPVTGANSYSWSLPPGASISGLSSSNSITVNFSNNYNGGFLCVKANNFCGSSSRSCLNIPKLDKNPTTPTIISGSNYVCSSSSFIYSITPIQKATSYLWTVPSGLVISSGQGSTSIVVTVSPGFTNGDIKVKAKNCIGSSSDRTLKIKGGVPNQPGSIAGASSVCVGEIKKYEITNVPNATSYSWLVTGGATIQSGQGTNTIFVDFGTATLNSSTVSVTADNICGSSIPKSKVISVSMGCKLATNNPESSSTTYFSLTNFVAYPNPSSGKLTVNYYCDFKSKVRLNLMDVLGKVLLNKTVLSVEGLNTSDLDLSDISTGMYLLTLQIDDINVGSLRIVVE